MKGSDFKRLASLIPDDADVEIQLPDDEPPVDFIIDSTNFVSDGHVIIFPLADEGYIWDTANNRIIMVEE